MRIEQLSLSEWEDVLPGDGFEVFHTPEALAVLESHATGDLRLYGGFKGQQPVGLLPAVVQERPLGTAVLSPPPGMGIPRLGPVLMPTSPKRRKREKVNSSFSQEVLDDIDADSSLTLFRMVCGTEYADPRPYVWADFDLDTSFTYRLDLDGADPDDLLKSFSKSLRREIRDGMDLDVTVTTHGVEGARDVYDETKSRYEEQDRQFPMDWPYVRDLVSALGDRARVYVARTPDGEFLSGITVLYSNDAGYFWQGGARATYRNVSVNSLLHWHIIRDIAEEPPVEGVSRYDLMGANTERLCRYKSKFGADLVPYYVVESPGKHMDVAKKAYQVLAR
jgi:hypothetical protein